MNVRLRIAAVIGAVALVVVAWLLVRAGDGRGARAVEPVRVETALAAPEPEPASLPHQSRDSAPAPAERETVPVAESEPAKTGDAALGPDEALLLVDVVSADTGKPLGGVRLVVLPERGAPSIRHVAGSRAAVGESPVSDGTGHAELGCTAGVSLNLIASSEGLDDVTIHVPSLAPGERRRIELRLRSDSDFVFHARIVDAETEAPLPEATVRREREVPGSRFGSGEPIHAILGADGRLTYPGRSWQREYLSASAAGYAIKTFVVSTTHDAIDRELIVPLERAAEVDCAVFEDGNGVDGAIVRLETDAYRLALRDVLQDGLAGPKPEWSAPTDADGRAHVTGLPPGVELRVGVRAPRHEASREFARVVLEPGETRRLTIDLRGGGAIVGRLVETAGPPIPNATVWILPAEWRQRALLRYDKRPTATALTDAEGGFRFSDVTPGLWWVGPEPVRPGSIGDEGAVAPLAEVVEVDRSEVFVDIRTDVGRYIEGSVLARDGTPAVRTGVFARRAGIANRVHTATGEDGRFRLGPLVAGRWTLIAGEFPGEYAPGEPIEVDAGVSGVVLRAEWGGRIAGRAVDLDGGPIAEADIWTCRTDAEYQGPATSRTPDGKFERHGLSAGKYTISVRSRDGRIGVVRDLTLAPGERIEDLVITVEPSQRLTLRNADSARLSYGLWLGRAPLELGGLDSGRSIEALVPTGELTIEARWPGDATPQTQTVTIARGEAKEIVLKRSP